VLQRERYLQAVGVHSAVIARAADLKPDQVVPSCPQWRVRDLAFHVACVLRLWTDVVQRASVERKPLGEGMSMPADEAMSSLLRVELDAFLEVLGTADPGTTAWTWWPDKTAAWIPRRMACEVAIHAWDAANALDEELEFEADVAADGIAEIFATKVPFGNPPPQHLEGEIHLTASGDHGTALTWRVIASQDRYPTLEGPSHDSGSAVDPVSGARAAIRGSASDLFLLLWRRRQIEALEARGDLAFAREVLAFARL
jgi:uncharacterized protein (TIGR03083 family)